MPKRKNKMAGELYREATADSTRYDPLEVGYALSESVLAEVWKCIDAHENVLDTPEFCVVLLMADDNILRNAKRVKYYAWPFLPEPRPRQTVFHYRRSTGDICRLWSIPTAAVMATMSSMPMVAKRWQETKWWCDIFFQWAGDVYRKSDIFSFYRHIRSKEGITLLSEKEHVASLRGAADKRSDASQDQIEALFPEAFDAFEAFKTKVIDPE